MQEAENTTWGQYLRAFHPDSQTIDTEGETENKTGPAVALKP